MRKILMTTVLAAPLTLGTAYAQVATTATDEPVTATTPDGVDAVVITDQDADAALVVDADAAAAADKVIREQAPNELRIDWITGTTVTSPSGDTIGDISGLIVDGDTGQMIAATVGVGGFLGIGAKEIAIAWDDLTVNYDAREITSNLTREEAEAAPEYVFRDRDSVPATGDTTAVTDPATAPVTGAGDPVVEPGTADTTLDGVEPVTNDPM